MAFLPCLILGGEIQCPLQYLFFSFLFIMRREAGYDVITFMGVLNWT